MLHSCLFTVILRSVTTAPPDFFWLAELPSSSSTSSPLSSSASCSAFACAIFLLCALRLLSLVGSLTPRAFTLASICLLLWAATLMSLSLMGALHTTTPRVGALLFSPPIELLFLSSLLALALPFPGLSVLRTTILMSTDLMALGSSSSWADLGLAVVSTYWGFWHHRGLSLDFFVFSSHDLSGPPLVSQSLILSQLPGRYRLLVSPICSMSSGPELKARRKNLPSRPLWMG
mmetsp:Transcript_15863/g.32399  ORF Transcript_15863/g.32399 Transcript_15863/m.32399 type:complete len:232 (-) Transcript_15863:1102-1797(-)